MDTIISMVNQITVTVPDVNTFIGIIMVIVFGSATKMVWDTITQVGRR